MRSFYESVAVAACALAALFSSSCSSDSSTTSSSSGATKTESFQNDVFPILQKNCALTACHGSKQSNLNIYISNDFNQVYDELTTGKSGEAVGMPYIAPGNPNGSWLMLKVDMKNVIPQCGNACGTEMPPYAENPGDSLLSSATRDVIRNWISQGAKGN